MINYQIRKIGGVFLGLHLESNNQEVLNQLDSEYRQDFFSLDATSYYMFGRMLVDKNYALGRKIQQINDRISGQSQIQTINRSQLRWLASALNQIQQDMLQGFNCSRKQLLEILAYCRKSVQTYFFSTYMQRQANLDLKTVSFASGFENQRKQLKEIMPETYKQFTMIQQVHTSMDILLCFFKAGIVFQVQCEIKKIGAQEQAHMIHLIKTCFSGVVGEKGKLLGCFGYSEADYMEFVGRFKFDHEVTL